VASEEGPIQVLINKAPPGKTLKELKDRLAKRKKEYQTDKTPWKAVSLMLDQWVQGNFQSEGKKVGGWRPFKAGGRWIPVGNVAKGKRAGLGATKRGMVLDTSAKLLQDTGRLRSSFLPFATMWNAGIGSDLDYAKKHEDGDPSRKLPARRMLPKRSEVIDEAHDILQRMTMKTLNK